MNFKILIIIPCYNEYLRLPINEIESFLKKNSQNVQLLFVNDGSTDQTISLLNTLQNSNNNLISILDLKENVGKAEAVRIAMLKNQSAEYDYIGYFDADLATPLEEIYFFIDKLTFYQPLVLMGSRVKLLGLTQIERKSYRHYFGRIFATIVSNMLGLPVYDTQCGAKLIKINVVPDVFKEPFISSWLFDVEILFRLLRLKEYNNTPNPILEVPLSRWVEKGDSKIPFSYLFKIPFELFRINVKYK